MKIVHYMNFLLIFVLLVAVCIIEENLVSSSLKDVQSQCLEISDVISNKDSLKDMEIVMLVDNLEYSWLNEESAMCYLVNHTSIKDIGYEITHLKTYITNNDIDAFKVSLKTIQFYCHSYLHFMGANFHNIL